MKRAYMAEVADGEDFMQEAPAAPTDDVGTGPSTVAYSAQEDQDQEAGLPEGHYWVDGSGQTFQWH